MVVTLSSTNAPALLDPAITSAGIPTLPTMGAVVSPQNRGTGPALPSTAAAVLTDPSTITRAVLEDPRNAARIAPSLLTAENSAWIRALVRQNPEIVVHLPPSIRRDHIPAALALQPDLIAKPELLSGLPSPHNRLTRAGVRDLIEQGASGAVIAFCGPELRDDLGVALAAVRRTPQAFSLVSERLRQSPEFMSAAIAARGELLEHAPNWNRDQNFVLSAIRNNPAALQFANPELLRDPNFLGQAVQAHPHAALFLNSAQLRTLETSGWSSFPQVQSALAIRDNRTAVRDILIQNPERFGAPAIRELCSDRSFVIDLVRANPAVFAAIPNGGEPNFRTDRSVIHAAVAGDVNMLSSVSRQFLIDNPDLMADLVRTNVQAYQRIATILQASPAVEIPAAVTAARDSMVEAHGLLGLTQYNRFDNSREILRNRYDVSPPELQAELRRVLGDAYFAPSNPPDTRPIAYVNYGQADHNGCFAQVNVDTVDRLTRGYRVVFFESTRGDEFTAHLRTTTTALGSPVSLVVIGGHGTQQSIQFGHHSETSHLRLSDPLPRGDGASMLVPGGTVVMISCSTGANGSNHVPGRPVNMAQMMHDYFGGNGLVIAPTIPTYPMIQLDGDGHYSSVVMSNNVGSQYGVALPATPRLLYDRQRNPEAARVIVAAIDAGYSIRVSNASTGTIEMRSPTGEVRQVVLGARGIRDGQWDRRVAAELTPMLRTTLIAQHRDALLAWSGPQRTPLPEGVSTAFAAAEGLDPASGRLTLLQYSDGRMVARIRNAEGRDLTSDVLSFNQPTQTQQATSQYTQNTGSGFATWGTQNQASYSYQPTRSESSRFRLFR